MHWFFRDISDDPSEKELTQLDQFNNDEVALAEALVRETVQNSTDARRSSSDPVRVHFSITTSEQPDDRDFLQQVLLGLSPHLAACGFPLPAVNGPIRLLTIEDFGTTGLQGSVETKDDGQFCGFWRRFGRSNKKGSAGGRWGLGKLVFPSASQIRTVIGLTRRPEEDCAWLMGQAILRNHAAGGKERDSVGFWCRDTEVNGLPSSDPQFCGQISRSVKFSRQIEPGLSLVVPFLLEDIEASQLVAATVKNYYFPLLTGSLEVKIDDTVINADTFEAVWKTLASGAVSGSLLNFVRSVQGARKRTPEFMLPADWQSSKLTGEMLGTEATNSLRGRLKAGQVVSVRAPITVVATEGRAAETHVDIYFESALPGVRPQALVVRGAITVPGEAKRLSFPDCHAALLAIEDEISQLLGDAENPSHTMECTGREAPPRLAEGELGAQSRAGRCQRNVRATFRSGGAGRSVCVGRVLLCSEIGAANVGKKAGHGRPVRDSGNSAEGLPHPETVGRIRFAPRSSSSRRPASDAGSCSVRVRRPFRQSIQTV